MTDIEIRAALERGKLTKEQAIGEAKATIIELEDDLFTTGYFHGAPEELMLRLREITKPIAVLPDEPSFSASSQPTTPEVLEISEQMAKITTIQRALLSLRSLLKTLCEPNSTSGEIENENNTIKKNGREQYMNLLQVKQAFVSKKITEERALGEVEVELVSIDQKLHDTFGDTALTTLAFFNHSGPYMDGDPKNFKKLPIPKAEKDIYESSKFSIPKFIENLIDIDVSFLYVKQLVQFKLELLDIIETKEKTINSNAVKKRFAEREFLSDTEIRLKLEREEINDDKALLEVNASDFGVERMIFDSVPLKVWNDETVWRPDMIEKYGYESLIIERMRLKELHALIMVHMKKEERKAKTPRKDRTGLSALEIEQAIARGVMNTERAIGEINAIILGFDHNLQKANIDYDSIHGVFVDALNLNDDLADDQRKYKLLRKRIEPYLNGYTFVEALELMATRTLLCSKLGIDIGSDGVYRESIPEAPIKPIVTAANMEPIIPEQFIIGLKNNHLEKNDDGTYTIITNLLDYLMLILRANLPVNMKMFQGILKYTDKKDGKEKLYTTSTLAKKITEARGQPVR